MPGGEIALDEAGLFPMEAPQEKSLIAEPVERGTKAGLRLQKIQGERRGEGWLCGEGKGAIPEVFGSPASALTTCWGVFGFAGRSLLLQGKFSLVACTYLPVC